MGIVISAVVGGIGALASAVWGGVSYAIALGILGLASIVIRTDPGVSMPTIDPSFHDAHVMMRYTYGHDGSMGVEHIRGRNFTLGAFDAETGQGSLYGSGVEGEEVPRVNVTGVFFQGDHRPNGTMVMTMPGGVLHHGNWTVSKKGEKFHKHAETGLLVTRDTNDASVDYHEPKEIDWENDLDAVHALMELVGEFQSDCLWSSLYLATRLLNVPTKATGLGRVLSLYVVRDGVHEEPTFEAAIVTTEDRELPSDLTSKNISASDEHIFVTLRTFNGPGPWGPQIFDSEGGLVFYSDPRQKGAQPALAYQDPHPCEFSLSTKEAGQQHGHWNPTEYTGSFQCVSKPLAHARGHMISAPIVYNDNYELAHHGDFTNRIETFSGEADGHEFHMLPGGRSYVSSAYIKKRWDLTGLMDQRAIVGPQPTAPKKPDAETDFRGVQWIYDACFQEVDVRSRKVTFSWWSTDWLNMNETLRPFVGPYPEREPFDAVHINSVDRDVQGDYLILMKWFAQVVKVAGLSNPDHEPGTPIWRLGGTNSTFVTQDDNLPFFWQHSARFQTKRVVDTPFQSDDPRNESKTWEAISVYDTHCTDASKQTCDTPSSGKLIKLDFDTQLSTASLLQQYSHPAGEKAWAAGNMQILPNGNVWVGYGHLPEATEFEYRTGAVIKHYQLGASSFAFPYRVVRGHWRGRPTWAPNALAYSHGCASLSGERLHESGKAWNTTSSPTTGSELHTYVSWNGDTETKGWRMEILPLEDHAGNTGGQWKDLGSFNRSGFETHLVLPVGEGADVAKLPAKIRLFALDNAGHPLPHGVVTTSIFVPSLRLTRGKDPVCSVASCQPYFTHDDADDDVHRCRLFSSLASKATVDPAAATAYRLDAGTVQVGSTINQLTVASTSGPTRIAGTSASPTSHGSLFHPTEASYSVDRAHFSDSTLSSSAFPASLSIVIVFCGFLAFRMRRMAGTMLQR